MTIPAAEKRRLTEAIGEAAGVRGDDQNRTSLQRRISGAALLDVRGLSDREIRFQAYELIGVPDRCTVVLVVGNRDLPVEGKEFFVEAAQRLSFDVLGDPEIVPRWMSMLRGERWPWEVPNSAWEVPNSGGSPV